MDIHTVPKAGDWINERNGEQVGPTYTKKKDAVNAGRDLARTDKVEHVIHNADGTIRQKNSYGNDPPGRG